jgi:hypothetical protein
LARDEEARIFVFAPVPSQPAQIVVAALHARKQRRAIQDGGVEEDAGAAQIHGEGANLADKVRELAGTKNVRRMGVPPTSRTPSPSVSLNPA